MIPEILDCLKTGEPFAVATVITSSGSTPRTSGSRMIVRKDRSITGTIGGGLVESRAMDACVDLIETGRCRIDRFVLNREHKDDLDMICGGDMAVLMESVYPSAAVVSLYQQAAGLEERGLAGCIVSRVIGGIQSEFTVARSVVQSGTVIAGDPLPEALLDWIRENRFAGTAPVIRNQGLAVFIIDPLVKPDTIYIFGAGHVGLCLAQMAHLTGFDTVVIDDRKEFANTGRFPHARKVLAVDHFSRALESLSIDSSGYVVILTRGHLHDETVLAQALKTEAAYIGMIGSRSKRDAIYASLLNKGVPQERLDAVYSPVGLDIHSETPAEIAVSIIGEIIKVRGEK